MSLLVPVLCAVLAAPAAAPSEAEVSRAIAKGVAYLRERQNAGGDWPGSTTHGDWPLGVTALAGLALLENGVDRDDPAIARATRVVRSLAESSAMTYDLVLAILYLTRIHPEGRGPDDDLIRTLARRLARGQRGTGMWTYVVPSGERSEGLSIGQIPENLQGGDNSNTQFALLGMWAGSRRGVDADDALERIGEHFRSTQTDEGRWGYMPHAEGTPAMNCAGLMGLAISAARPKLAERQSARARGAALARDPVFQKALEVVTRDAKKIGRRSAIYHLWSLERVCVALGLRKLDDFDWYGAGANILVDLQRGNGSWDQDGGYGVLPDTCLALLFLRKANLAFELDRVLKLPGSAAVPAAATTPAAPASPPPAPAASGGAEVIIGSTEDRNFPEIAVDFQVKRPDGTPLLTARREDFRVEEGGRDVPILKFTSPTEVQPTTVVLVVDRSLSMEEERRIDALKSAVRTFLKVMPPGSRVAVVAFGSDVTVLAPFADDPARIGQAVDALTPAGATRYYDAVARALEMISAERGRRAVLALTDGEDTFSQTSTIESVIAAARTAGVPVHTLGLGSEDEIESNALKRLAAETRGRYFPAQQADQLRGIYEELAKGLRESYGLTYRTERKLPDGTLRPIRLYYKESSKAAESAVFIRGMVVPAAGWSWLFLVLVAALVGLAALPGLRRSAS